MSQKLFTLVLLMAVALTVCYAECDCDVQDQDCVRECVTDADVCITNCEDDTACYEACIGDKWPQGIRVQDASATPTAVTATHSTASHSSASASASSTHHSSSSASPTSSSSASPSPTSAAAPYLDAFLHRPVCALAAAVYLYMSA